MRPAAMTLMSRQSEIPDQMALTARTPPDMPLQLTRAGQLSVEVQRAGAARLIR